MKITGNTRGAEYLHRLNRTTDPRADEVAEILAWAKLRAFNRHAEAVRRQLREVRHG